jgi:Flp pilus assembly protein TadG
MRGFRNSSRRRGVAVVYIVVVLIVMLGFCSFAVDLGRVQTAKTELRRAADAAARAGLIKLEEGVTPADSTTTTNVDNAAETMADDNNCDGTPVVITASNVSIGIWNMSTSTFSTSGTADNVTTYSAVRIETSRNVPLLFGEILGKQYCTVNATSTAALVAVTAPLTDYVSAHGNPWLAGEPSGTTASQPDPGYDNPSANNVHPWKYDIANPSAVASAVTAEQSSGSYTTPADSSKLESTDYSANEPYASPVAFDVTPGAVLQISVPTNSSNEANNQGYLNGGSGNTYANGSMGGTIMEFSDDGANPTMTQGTTTTSGSEHGISNIITPINSMVGVFMDQNGATYGADSTEENETSVPPGLDFSTQAARDYSSGTTQSTTAAEQEMNGGQIEPVVNQSFYVGDGQTSTSTTETIIVPSNAYALFLGTMDGHEWSNNTGGFNATITELRAELVQ